MARRRADRRRLRAPFGKNASHMVAGALLLTCFLASCDDEQRSGGGGASDDLSVEDLSPADLGEVDLGRPDSGGADDLELDADQRSDSGQSLDVHEGVDLPPSPDLEQETDLSEDLGLLDVGPAPDSELPSDGGADLEPLDASEVDGGGGDPTDLGTPCEREELPDDRDRIVLLGHPFGNQAGVLGQELRVLTLLREDELLDLGQRVDVGLRPRHLAILPGGRVGLVLGEEGELLSFLIEDGALVLREQVQIPPADPADLVISPEGDLVWILGSNSTEEGGVSTVRVGCEGELELAREAFFPLRLCNAMALIPGTQRALLLGGQAVFEPVDDMDTRLLERDGEGWRQLSADDVWHDFVSAEGLGVSPDGRIGLVPNASIFSEEGASLSVLSLGEAGVEELQRLEGLSDPRELLFSLDGQTALLTLGEPGRVVVFGLGREGLVERSQIRGIGLAGQMAHVRSGPLSDTVLLPSVDPQDGPNVAILRITAPGEVLDLGQLPLGPGGENIPGPIAISP